MMWPGVAAVSIASQKKEKKKTGKYLETAETTLVTDLSVQF
jgi:hypothetical protein